MIKPKLVKILCLSALALVLFLIANYFLIIIRTDRMTLSQMEKLVQASPFEIYIPSEGITYQGFYYKFINNTAYFFWSRSYVLYNTDIFRRHAIIGADLSLWHLSYGRWRRVLPLQYVQSALQPAFPMQFSIMRYLYFDADMPPGEYRFIARHVHKRTYAMDFPIFGLSVVGSFTLP